MRHLPDACVVLRHRRDGRTSLLALLGRKPEGVVIDPTQPGNPVQLPDSTVRQLGAVAVQRHPRKCKAHKKDGTLCERWAMEGQEVCPYHGGKSPQALRSARERLAALVDPAIAAYRKALRSGDMPTALRAARDMLRAAGLHEPPAEEMASAEDVQRLTGGLLDIILKHVPRANLPLVLADVRGLAVRFGRLMTVPALPAREPEPVEQEFFL